MRSLALMYDYQQTKGNRAPESHDILYWYVPNLIHHDPENLAILANRHFTLNFSFKSPLSVFSLILIIPTKKQVWYVRNSPSNTC